MATAAAPANRRTIDGMSTATTTRPARDYTSVASRMVLASAGRAGDWHLLPCRRRDAWLARLAHRRVDARLAAGDPPESGRLLATRAAQLVRPARRRAVAKRWDDLAAAARSARPLPAWDVADQVQLVADVLRSAHPVDARGVALAVTLLPAADDALRRVETGGAEVAAAAACTALAAL
jgi:hypothetical protein